jgi:hypothetical protein
MVTALEKDKGLSLLSVILYFSAKSFISYKACNRYYKLR